MAARRTIIDTDPPEHTKLRKIVSGSFSQRAVAVYQHFVEGLTEQVLDAGLAGADEFDFVDAVAKEVPIRVLARIMGLPGADLDQFIDLGDRLIANTDPDVTDVVWGRDDTDAYRRFPFRSPYGKQLWDLGREVVRERLREPGDDLLSTLLRAEVDGDRLTETDLDNFFSILVVAGNETTRIAIAQGVLAFCEHPEPVGPAARRPGSCSARPPTRCSGGAAPRTSCGGPPPWTPSWAAREIRAGDKVVLWYVSGNRDESEFADPDVFDVGPLPQPASQLRPRRPAPVPGRAPGPAGGPGGAGRAGPPGGRFELAGPPRRIRSNFTNGLRELPVRAHLAAAAGAPVRKIDAFAHILPPRYAQRLESITSGPVSDRILGYRPWIREDPALTDLDARWRTLDQFGDYRQVLTLAVPPLDELGGPALARDLARAANDELAGLVARYPDRFAGFSAALPMSDPDAAAAELSRAMTELGALGAQLHTNVGGQPLDAPRFEPVFETVTRLRRRALAAPHPQRSWADYPAETRSRYGIWWSLGWPYETSVRMARLVYSGCFDRHPGLRVIAHHAGAMVPHFAGAAGRAAGGPGPRRDHGRPESTAPLDYFRRFYTDTALFGAAHAVRCAVEFLRRRSPAVRHRHAARRPDGHRGHDRRHRGARPAGGRDRRDLRRERDEGAADPPARTIKEETMASSEPAVRAPGGEDPLAPRCHRPVRRVHRPGVLLGLRDPAGRRGDQRVRQGRRGRVAAVGADRRGRRVRAGLDRVQLRSRRSTRPARCMTT